MVVLLVAASWVQAGAGSHHGGAGAAASRGPVKGSAASAPAAPPAAAGAAGTTGSAGATGASGDSAAAPAAESMAKLGDGSVSSASAALGGAGADAALLAQIAKLPPLTNMGIDVTQRSADTRAHLNTVLRFYRAVTVPIQKVGEPSDVLYAEQSQSEATQIAVLAFEAAKNEAALLERATTGSQAAAAAPAASTDGGQTQVERIALLRSQAMDQLKALQAQETSLTQALQGARGDQRATLIQQQEQLQGGIELQQAMVDALARITSFSVSQVKTGLAGDIDRLQRSAPELLSKPLKTPAPPVLESLAAAHDAGVSTQAGVVFTLIGALRTIDQQIKQIDEMNLQIANLRLPFVKVLRGTIAQGQALSQQSVDLEKTPTSNAQDLANVRKQFDELTTRFQVLASATMPLSQESVLLDNARGTLTTWRATIDAEYKDVLRSLLLRVLLIAIALGVLAGVNRVVNQATVRYVSDLRRRRQFLLLRRIVIGFLSGLILIFGFVTQFSSLATFAGFITAGIAVGLQSILLSVAAYFFIVGRYGIRVGDRVTVANVTGEVIEVGLVRFYMMELVGTGTELHSTGRVAVFANSVLFQSGTPIYKQMPGTEYAWHELTAKLNGTADVRATSEAVLEVVQSVYASYSSTIQAQHQAVETWMGTALPAPEVESRLQLVEGGLQFAVLFPVEINRAAQVDQQIAERLIQEMRTEGPMKAGTTELPIIKAAVKS